VKFVTKFLLLLTFISYCALIYIVDVYDKATNPTNFNPPSDAQIRVLSSQQNLIGYWVLALACINIIYFQLIYDNKDKTLKNAMFLLSFITLGVYFFFKALLPNGIYAPW